MRARCSLMLVGVLVGAILMSFAQVKKEERTEETRAQIPALSKFHTPIYKLWHTAWPNKDTAMMTALVPDIEKGVAEVAAAKLPGILREKKALWESNVRKLQEVAAEYKAATNARDEKRLLEAGEKLHGQYEALVRVTRPPLKELDAYHGVLYMLYHYYMPEGNMEKMKTSVAELKLKMDTLNAARLPDRWKAKEEAFVAARAKLSSSLEAVVNVMPAEDKEAVTKAIRVMHANYEALDRVFE